MASPAWLDPDEFLTVEEVMLQLRVAQSTVERLIREGKLPALTLSEGLRVRRRDLEAGEDAQRRP